MAQLLVALIWDALFLDFAYTNVLQKPCWHTQCSKPLTWGSHNSIQNQQETGSFILLCHIAPGQDVDQFLVMHDIQTMEKIVRPIPGWLGVRRARNSGGVSKKFPKIAGAVPPFLGAVVSTRDCRSFTGKNHRASRTLSLEQQPQKCFNSRSQGGVTLRLL